LLQAQEENQKKEEIKRTEEQNEQLTKVEELLETQLGQFRKEQDNKLTETRNELQHEFKNTLENKIETISLTVANQVASKLMDAFKEYITPTQSIEGGASVLNRTKACITQDGETPTQSPQPKLLKNIEYGDNTSTHRTEQSTSAFTDINMIDKQSPNKRSPHDKSFSEREKVG